MKKNKMVKFSRSKKYALKRGRKGKRRWMKRYGNKNKEFKILRYLRRTGHKNTSQISFHIGMSREQTRKLLDKLESEEKIKHSPIQCVAYWSIE